MDLQHLDDILEEGIDRGIEQARKKSLVAGAAVGVACGIGFHYLEQALVPGVQEVPLFFRLMLDAGVAWLPFRYATHVLGNSIVDSEISKAKVAVLNEYMQSY
ncbi:MAG: hypothetical protein CMH61_02500 [Nanoarchaeota archaeon]|nr:hypothetical protein [Nanoarchaeota archaeon]|tara:strand:- start:769 stop:1077 length:309 start_codon:yes stop_codon:yes gene_type:complete